MSENSDAQILDVVGTLLEVGVFDLAKPPGNFGKRAIRGDRSRLSTFDALFEPIEQDGITQEQQVCAEDQGLFLTELARGGGLHAQEVVLRLLQRVAQSGALGGCVAARAVITRE